MKLYGVFGLVLGFSVACSSSGNDGEIEDVGGDFTSDYAEEQQEDAGEEFSESAASSGEDADFDGEMPSLEGVAMGEAEADDLPSLELGSSPSSDFDSPVASEEGSNVAYPTTSLLNMRSGPGMNHGVGRVARFGEAINLSGQTRGIWQETSDGLWVSSRFTSESRPTEANDSHVGGGASRSQSVSESPSTSRPSYDDSSVDTHEDESPIDNASYSDEY